MHSYKRFSLIFTLTVTLTLLATGTLFAFQAENVIFLIGDGMGLSQITAARYFKGAEMNLDKMDFTGLVNTHSADTYVTDSAAAGTALATGFKTTNGMISITPVGSKPMTLLEAAQNKGKRVGLISTTRITHATPASFAAHVENRDMENQIAEQILNHRVDVILGGGSAQFLPEELGGKRKDEKNLIVRAREMGYDILENRFQLLASESDQILGLFSSSHMNYELDRDKRSEPSIAEMTAIALKSLNRGNDGFFLMVEGGRIDHAAHGHDIAGTVTDLIAFDEAVRVALEFAKVHPDTLVVVTADHETGGLALSDGDYKFDPAAIKKINRSAEFIARNLNEDRSNVRDLMEEYAGIDLTIEEYNYIAHAEGTYGPSNAIGAIYSSRALVGWTTDTHSGSNVAVMATGPGAELFTGFMDNTDITNIIARAAGYKMSIYTDYLIK